MEPLLLLFQHNLTDRQVPSLLEGIAVSYSSVSRWDVLVCGSVQGDFCWCNLLNFIDLGAISRVIACVSLVRRHKNIAFPWSGSIIF